MKIENDVANVLADSGVEGNKLFLPKTQLDRKLYVAVNKVLVAIDGKWNRKEKAHIFPASPEDIIEEILLTGEYTDKKKEYQFFETPTELARQMVDMANIKESETVLEPSAGKGRIASLIEGCHCIELNPDNAAYLEQQGLDVLCGDFLTFRGSHDVIIANPPFTRQQDIDHVNHMLDLFKRCVISVMSASVQYRDNEKTVEFRERISSLHGTIEALPDKTFSKSGTNVKTCLVHVEL